MVDQHFFQASFLFGYPEDLVYKLYERKGNCLFQFHGFPR